MYFYVKIQVSNERKINADPNLIWKSEKKSCTFAANLFYWIV